MVRRVYLKTLCIAVVLVLIVVAFQYLMAGHDYAELAASGVQDRATVIEVRDENHVQYEFRAGEHLKRYWRTVPGAKLGDTIPITYSPRHPYIWRDGDGRALYRRWQYSTALAAAVAFLVPFLFRRLARMRDQPSNRAIQRTVGSHGK